MRDNKGGDAAAVTGPAEGGPRRCGIHDWQLAQARQQQVTIWTMIEGDRAF